jgi:AcrR family transcriptional regulator
MAKRVVKKRDYDNALRVQKSEKARKLIIDTYVKLLEERRGQDVQVAEIAERSGVSQRTLFRFFKDRALLEQATDEYLRTLLQGTLAEITEKTVAGYARHMFASFDEHENLVMAYLYSSFGVKARTQLRKQLNKMLVARILEERKLELTPENQPKIAVIVSLINAKIWDDLRADFNMSGKKTGQAVEWAITALMKEL